MSDEFNEINIKDEIKINIDAFVKFHLKNKNRLVLITSGGTTVPLEAKTVRFIDNFSIGTRGSVSGEEFIKKSYAVLFLYRKRSLEPYERKFNNLNMLDIMKYSDETHTSFKFEKFDMKKLFNDYSEAKKNNLLLKVDFTSVFDYLSLLEYSCRAISNLRSEAIVYLAAAVSDFYIPKNELPEHKIQSNCDGLTVSLKPVPKCLGKLRAEWCPEAFIVSFKLETDKEILDFKCKKSLASYKQDLVIGNILEDRKNSVSIMNSQGDVHIIKVNSESKDIEEDIIEYLYSLHSAFIEKKS